jgi:hypothetical protein
MSSDLDRVAELNTLMKMFGIDGKVMFFPKNSLPFHLQGIFHGVHQGTSRNSVAEIEQFVQDLINEDKAPGLGVQLQTTIAKRAAK